MFEAKTPKKFGKYFEKIDPTEISRSEKSTRTGELHVIATVATTDENRRLKRGFPTRPPQKGGKNPEWGDAADDAQNSLKI